MNVQVTHVFTGSVSTATTLTPADASTNTTGIAANMVTALAA
jgi:hypothetical protein